MEEDTGNLNPCALGTKAFWDSAYETEIKNYVDNGDIGEKIGTTWHKLNSSRADDAYGCSCVEALCCHAERKSDEC
jgi:hypothetical protein